MSSAHDVPPLLALRGITRRFGAVVALEEASLSVRPGTVHALLGENGAGKTTLMRVAYGMLAPDAGRIEIDGRARAFRSPADALAAGIGMVHQHYLLVPAMTVAENVALAAGGWRYDPAAAAARVREVAARAGVALDPDARVADLSVAAQQRLEIVKALTGEARVLVLDEPTAALAPSETGELLAWVRRHADAGHAVVLITHKLREALAVADDVTVLRRGRVVLSGPARGATVETLAAAMLGGEGAGGSAAATVLGEGAGERAGSRAGEPAGSPPDHDDRADVARTQHRTNADGIVLARARALSLHDERTRERIVEATLELRAGEIAGVVGVEGAGHQLLLAALAGRATPTAGTLELPERVGYVPEDRHRDAVALDLDLVENVALRGLGARRGRMPWRALRDRTAALLRAADVRAADVAARLRTLSGGNQQKLVLARELDDGPQLVVAVNPTRGLDVGATAAVHARLRDERARGAAVIVYSGDVDEVLALADRVLVVYAGRVREVPARREAVGRAMLGVAES